MIKVVLFVRIFSLVALRSLVVEQIWQMAPQVFGWSNLILLELAIRIIKCNKYEAVGSNLSQQIKRTDCVAFTTVVLSSVSQVA
jgi:hypothetical protein